MDNIPNIDYILLAEFDIDSGSILKHQYPNPTGEDESILAELMLPDGAHMRESDWTYFILNQSNPLKRGSNTTRDTYYNDDLVYCINLVRTKHDSGARRGAVVKSMALCSRYPYIHIYKPILLLALENYYRNPSTDSLEDLYNSINAMDISKIPKLNKFQKTILRHSKDNTMFGELFDKNITKTNFVSFGNTHTTYDDDDNYNSRVIDTKYFNTNILYQGVNLPIKIPLITYPEEIGETSVAKLVLKFNSNTTTGIRTNHLHLDVGNATMHPITILINAILTEKRIIFLGHNLPAEEVCSYVLAAALVGSGGGNVLKGLNHRIFPYTSLTSLDRLLKVPGFIAGVTNPTFEDKHQWWDILFNINTGKITISSKLHSQPIIAVKSTKKHSQQNENGIGGRHSFDLPVQYSQANQGSREVKADKGIFYDQEFINDIFHAIENKYGEISIRTKFENYIRNFLLLVGLYEQEKYGRKDMYYAVRSYENDEANIKLVDNTLNKEQLCYGYTDEIHKLYYEKDNNYEPNKYIRDLRTNSGRITGFMNTKLYINYKREMAATKGKSLIMSGSDLTIHLRNTTKVNPVTTIDLQMMICRLRDGSYLKDDEIKTIFTLLYYSVVNEDQIFMLLSYLPQNEGGLQPLICGLYHQYVSIRLQTATLLQRIESNMVSIFSFLFYFYGKY
ncbi:hypothetical protein BB559_002858 [Furculomyces boomerangus]|uniref:UDENN domain-containing protein n=1 Tax=Furculomyces boomerangus TaxID=61424 RepID=A0A2T9YRL0_9FUNG|nr:hypothetical protein BB559_002858 [Furculomyces boomerangus]